MPDLVATRSGTSSKSIPSVVSDDSSAVPSSFATPKSTISRKKPAGLSIASLKAHRAPPVAPGNGDSPEFQLALSSAEQLRLEISRLQLSSKSSSSGTSAVESVPSSPSAPITPGSVNVPNGNGARKKSTASVGGKARRKDKDGEELVKNEDLEVLADLGAGNGGTVTKVWNKKRNCIMARKLILVDAKPAIKKQILRELQIMNDCASPYIVGYYGCFPIDVHVGIVMEYMDAGSLDYIYRHNGPVSIEITGKVAEAVLRGLMYLYDVHRIIHRDIKPSNILANTAGEIKICDFGVSGELINSIANTFVGTSTYMSPERIQGAAYTIKSDVWSLGISLIELALGRFPFAEPPDSSSEADASDSEAQATFDANATLPLAAQRAALDLGGNSNGNGNNSPPHERRRSRGVSLAGGGSTMSILDLLQHIVNEPAPKLYSPRKDFPQEAVDFVEDCLSKDPATRKSPQELLKSSWIVDSKVTKADLEKWTKATVEE
ncbi:hypothetical protein TREMEDRAFT_26879 [Tremella mesenterica DSM 1558]|uniref:uncharacterized protein n=1 Tax=Tremella mesenterica (strain ATCC 24925 / CBS 8224 / DSM 1558 / NBRC 9311 / NRRL Y-6157 / RJB 2259-6 / UBC 559-6) TaxID=578456 RepID=UPI0003F498E6|nr:uncharacterized protein TREMEDRAFT_26879 [Tremella mesenterica DSM 1558]EIW72783.1 hypothetical protein TREMEDRAFT_26879 [Tremella mesenterica DSM 1558]